MEAAVTSADSASSPLTRNLSATIGIGSDQRDVNHTNSIETPHEGLPPEATDEGYRVQPVALSLAPDSCGWSRPGLGESPSLLEPRLLAASGFLLHVATLAMHLAASYFLWEQQSPRLPCVLALTVGPTVVLNIMSFGLTMFKMLASFTPGSRAEIVVTSLFCSLLHILQLGAIFRYFLHILLAEMELLFVRCFRTSERPVHSGYLFEVPFLPYMYLVEAFAHSFPQLVLQLYILVSDQGELSNASETVLAASVVVTALNLARLLTTSRQLLKRSSTWPGLALVFLWQLSMGLSRALSLALFASRFLLACCLLCAGHWLVATFLLLRFDSSSEDAEDRRRRPCRVAARRLAVGLLRGFMALLAFVRTRFVEDLGEHQGPTRRLQGPLCLALFVENSAMAALWFAYGRQDAWFRGPALGAVEAAFILGLVCMLLYYRCFHRNVVGRSRRWSCDWLFPTPPPLGYWPPPPLAAARA